jgi:hypothetical protein
MSKIQINELNLNASEFNTLNAEETTEVVGGYYGGYYSSYYSFDDDFAAVQQGNFNATEQVALGGYFGDTYNTNSTSQNNSANIYQ